MFFALIISIFIFHAKQKYSNITKNEILNTKKIAQLPLQILGISLNLEPVCNLNF